MAQKVAVNSIASPEHVGWMTKQGGSWKSWKRRYFVLKGNELYYFKTVKDADKTGVIVFSTDSFVRKEGDKTGKKNLIAVGTFNRIYFMFTDTEQEQAEWIKWIQQALDTVRSGGGGGGGGGGPKNNVDLISSKSNLNASSRSVGEVSTLKSIGAFDKLHQGKSEIHFLENNSTPVCEFWQIWVNSIPKTTNKNTNSNNINKVYFDIAVSADMEKLSWRACGPQNVFIQNMVDFFWHVGAPDTEIERLNDIGSMVNPTLIGSWIEMSSKGGMDGGWYFPHDVSIQVAIKAADSGTPIDTFAQWTEAHHITQCTLIGRDMGAAPPRQTEFRFYLPGTDFSAKLSCALDAFVKFGFPAAPEEAVEILRSFKPSYLLMSLVTSTEGFVRIGIMVPTPPRGIVESLCNLSGGNSEQLLKFEKALCVTQVEFVEFQHLVEGFGYGVYREGFDVLFHYRIAEETCV